MKIKKLKKAKNTKINRPKAKSLQQRIDEAKEMRRLQRIISRIDFSSIPEFAHLK